MHDNYYLFDNYYLLLIAMIKQAHADAKGRGWLAYDALLFLEWCKCELV